jgi:hypothetical protein
MKKATMKKPNPGAVQESRSRVAGAGQAKVKERIDVALVGLACATAAKGGPPAKFWPAPSRWTESA